MSSIQIKRVETKKDLKRFIEFHYDLYKGNPYDVPNLYSDEVNTLSKDKNAAFDFCEAEYYLALKEGKIVGRVAAIIKQTRNGRRRTFALVGLTSLMILKYHVLCLKLLRSMVERKA